MAAALKATSEEVRRKQPIKVVDGDRGLSRDWKWNCWQTISKWSK